MQACTHDPAARIAVVIPVKPFAKAKTRLAPLLDPHERHAFAQAMLLDVLDAVAAALPARDLFVVTADDAAAALAAARGVEVIDEGASEGVNAALATASAQVAMRGFAGMLVVPGDVPLVTPADVLRIRARHAAVGGVTLVPSADRGGTNALCCSPADAIAFCYGTGSFRAHWRQAVQRRIARGILFVDRLGLDVDRPADVAALLGSSGAANSHAYLASIAVEERLARMRLSTASRAVDPRRASA